MDFGDRHPRFALMRRYLENVLFRKTENNIEMNVVDREDGRCVDLAKDKVQRQICYC
jgi:hypothetical protein